MEEGSHTTDKKNLSQGLGDSAVDAGHGKEMEVLEWNPSRLCVSFDVSTNIGTES